MQHNSGAKLQMKLDNLHELKSVTTLCYMKRNLATCREWYATCKKISLHVKTNPSEGPDLILFDINWYFCVVV